MDLSRGLIILLSHLHWAWVHFVLTRGTLLHLPGDFRNGVFDPQRSEKAGEIKSFGPDRRGSSVADFHLEEGAVTPKVHPESLPWHVEQTKGCLPGQRLQDNGKLFEHCNF